MTIVVSNKQRIHFVMEGERGAFLILHHGLFGSQRDWARSGFVQALAQDFRLIVPDALGHGRSDRPTEKEAYRLEQLSEDLIAIMNELDIRNAHFVGYSLGALVGLDLVMRHPERVRLIMLGGEAPSPSEEARESWREAAARIRAEGFAAWAGAEIAAGRLLREQAAELEGEQDAALALLEAMADWEIPAAESVQVPSPITIFAAGEDPAFERTQRLARRVQRARFLPFPEQTHRGLIEEKTALLEAMLRFIKITRRAPEEGGPPERRERPWGERGGKGRPWRDERRRGPEGAERAADAAAEEPDAIEAERGPEAPAPSNLPEGAPEAPPVAPAETEPEVQGGEPEPMEPSAESDAPAGEAAAEADQDVRGRAEGDAAEDDGGDGDLRGRAEGDAAENDGEGREEGEPDEDAPPERGWEDDPEGR